VQYNDITISHWISALEISDMYGFDSIRELAIRELSTPDKLDPVLWILLGIEYNVGHWVVSGCEVFITRDNGPRADEAKRLGEDITSIIWDMRDEYRAYYPDSRPWRHIVKAFESGDYGVSFDEHVEPESPGWD
jgi:hypothetical protein